MEYTKKIILAVVLALTNPTGATVYPIKKGASAQTDGFLFDNDSEREAAQYRIDADYYKTLSDKLNEKVTLEEKENQILEQRLQLYMSEAGALAKNQAVSESTERLYLLGAFALGVIGTAFVVRNVRP